MQQLVRVWAAGNDDKKKAKQATQPLCLPWVTQGTTPQLRARPRQQAQDEASRRNVFKLQPNSLP